ncbi:MAG: hypothetical protein ABIP55_04055, partial [Tepidisphaeraceae bacterium]
TEALPDREKNTNPKPVGEVELEPAPETQRLASGESRGGRPPKVVVAFRAAFCHKPRGEMRGVGCRAVCAAKVESF